MSLKREDWQEMWKSAKYMESVVKEMHRDNPRKLLLQTEINKIKNWIQSVIGQME